jgi:hypothetical protein
MKTTMYPIMFFVLAAAALAANPLASWWSDSSCVVYYSFDNDSVNGNSIQNMCGNQALNATTTNDVSQFHNTSVYGSSMDWGAAGYILSNSNLGISGSQDRTIIVWVQPLQTPIDGNILGWGAPESGNRSHLVFTTNGGLPTFKYGVSGGWCIGCDDVKAPATHPVTAGDTWQMLTITLNNTATRVTLYKNGTFLTQFDQPESMNTIDSQLDMGGSIIWGAPF